MILAPYGLLMSGLAARKPKYIRRRPQAPEPFQLDPSQLKALRQRIDLSQASPEFLEFVCEYHCLSVSGLEHLPRRGYPTVFVCNHTGTPLVASSCVIPETVLLLTHALQHYRQRSPRPLMGFECYQDEQTYLRHKEIFEALGCVPCTIENGVRILDMGDDVLIYPEGEDSLPPYQTRPFFWGFARMAWIAEAVIVPVALIGPHESRLRIDLDDGPIIFVTPIRAPNQTPYHLSFLPALDVRSAVPDLEDRHSLSLFCERVRHSIQVTLDSQFADRPLVEVARHLQQRHANSPGRMMLASPISPARDVTRP